MPPRVNLLDGVSTEPKQDDIIVALNDLLTELNQKLEAGEEVALDAATLSALEQITATVDNFPADYPDTSVLAKNEEIRVLLDSINTELATQQKDALTNDEMRASPLKVDAGTRSDIFEHQITVSPFAQVELRLDAADWQDFTNEATTGTGSISQGSGLVAIATGTDATGSAQLSSADSVEYRPGVGVFGGGTVVFTAGVTGSTQYAGIMSDLSFTDGVAFGYKGDTFGIRYMRGGSEVAFIAQANWDDPCLGAADSQFSRGGSVDTLDPTVYGGPYFIEGGLFGFAGWVASVWSPDNGFIPVHTWQNPADGLPVFESNTFQVVLDATKTSGATDISISGQCWVAGAYTDLIRFGDTGRFTDRTLGKPTVSTIVGKTTAGGGAYIPVKVSPSGALTMEAEQADHDNLNTNANLQVSDTDVNAGNPVPTDDATTQSKLDTLTSTVQTDGLTDTELRASDIEVNDDTAQTLITAVRDRIGTITDVDTAVNILDRILTELADHVVAGDLQTDALTDAELRATPVDVTDTNPPQTDALTDVELRASTVEVTLSGAELTERLLSKAPADGYRLWFDTADSDHLYTLEAPAGSGSSDTGFRGIRVTLDTLGNPVGAVETNTGASLTFDNRVTDTEWSA